MLKKKAINRIFITTVIFFVVFNLYSILEIDKKEIKTNEKKDILENIYTLNDDNYISKTSIYVSKVLTLEDKIKEKLEIMIEENNKNALLPSYFNPILPKNTKIEDVKIDDKLVKLYFSKELLNITEEQSEKMIEAIIYTVSEEDILGIEIYVDNKMLKYVPNTKKKLPKVMTKEFGINKTYDISSTNNIIKVVMSYYTENNNEYYEIPITKYVNDKREKLEIILDEIKKPQNTNLITFIENIDLLNYEIDKNKIKLNINSSLTEKEKSVLTSSIFNNYNVEKIEILTKKQNTLEKIEKNNKKIKKDIEK